MNAPSADKSSFSILRRGFRHSGQLRRPLSRLCPCTPRTSLEVSCADENRPVWFCFAIKIFLPCFQFDGLTVGPEYFRLVLVVSLKVIVDGLSADGAPHAGFSVLPPERDDATVEIISLLPLRKSQIVLLKGPPHPLCHERGERIDVHVDAGAVECL